MQKSYRGSPWAMNWSQKELQKWIVRSALITLVTWFGGPTPAAAQNNGNSSSSPPIVYVVNIAGGISQINEVNNSVIATAPDANSPSRIVVSADGKRAYVTHNFGVTLLGVGQITGDYRLQQPGQHGFVATPLDNQNQNNQ